MLRKQITKRLYKKQDFHDKAISLQKHTIKKLYNDAVSINHKCTHTYFNLKTQSRDRAITQSYTVHQHQTGIGCKLIQFTLLNLSMGYKQNGKVIVNPQNNKESIKIHIRNHVQFIIYIYTHIY